ncbi:hypothetical protein SEPCBS57363_006048 [Sporothrix epigloea]|uniref:Uncharacterized protein n=1 Tax=Sporothrix epigloea TaxID=1892477 RepID=A0ABP0E195_9PEZI
MTTTYRRKQTISDVGLGRPSTPSSIYSGPSIKQARSVNQLEELSLEVSVWPTFPLANLPVFRKPKVQNGRQSLARRAKAKSKAKEMDILEQVTEDESRLYNAIRKAKSQSEWRRMLHNLQETGGLTADVCPEVARTSGKAAQASKTKTSTATATTDSGTSDRPLIFRLPRAPAPLPPCLQCTLAGTCCSLTIRPYAKAFVNDKASTRQPRPALLDVRPPSCELTAAELARLSITADVGYSNTDLAASGLPWERQRLEQKMLREAIVRGSIDSPFLPQPPTQCARCERKGETACLQQSYDLANAVASTATGHQLVAWFASSGPPPLSLLPQHIVSLLDQMRPEPEEHVTRAATDQQFRQPGKRPRSQNPSCSARPALEAIFCRDPTVMAASEVAFKAQDLLEQIAQKYPRGTSAGNYFSQRHHSKAVSGSVVPSYLKDQGPQSICRGIKDWNRVRPAASLEVSRLLPRRSWMNVYAGRGVATAASTAFQAADTAKLYMTVRAHVSDYRAVPAALPAWRANDERATAVASDMTQMVCKYKWQDYFLDVAEDRAAVQFQKSKQEVKRKPLTTHTTVEAETETEGERQARVTQLALLLDQQIREKRKRAARLQSTPAVCQQKRSSENEAFVADLISTLTSRLDPEQTRRLATLLAGPVAAM